MGSSTYSHDDYTARSTYRATTGKPTFAYSAAIDSGHTPAKAHSTLNPFRVTRECRDSAQHPVSIPIGIALDTTGSLGLVPGIIQRRLSELMGTFLDDKASGKRYLGDGYPAILISAVDDYFAIGKEGALQVGQFESGIEIDDNLTNLWLTGQGGGNSGESYDLGLYFFARHTVHDHYEKRGRKGYLFIIGDEPYFETVSKSAVREVIGDTLQADIPLTKIVEEVRERYHVYFILPKMTSHWNDPHVLTVWKKLLGEEAVVKLEDPEAICSLLASLVAANEGIVSLADLEKDGIPDCVSRAVTVLPNVHPAARVKGSVPSVVGSKPAKRL